MDDWRSARPAPLPIPGNLVIEACSPTNAIAAMGLGMEHATALPCEIAVKVLNKDGVDGNEILMITYLDPHFMFSALFSDAFDELDDEELEDLLALPPMVLEDLQTIVRDALKWSNLKRTDTPVKLRQPDQLFFDMLPAGGKTKRPASISLSFIVDQRKSRPGYLLGAAFYCRQCILLWRFRRRRSIAHQKDSDKGCQFTKCRTDPTGVRSVLRSCTG